MTRHITFSEFPETCPKVDAIAAKLVEKTIRDLLTRYVSDDDTFNALMEGVSRAVDNAVEDIKDTVTIPFRDVLEQACRDRNGYADEKEVLERKVSDLSDEIYDLGCRIRELENELDCALETVEAA